MTPTEFPAPRNPQAAHAVRGEPGREEALMARFRPLGACSCRGGTGAGREVVRVLQQRAVAAEVPANALAE